MQNSIVASLARLAAVVCCLLFVSCKGGGDGEKSLLNGRAPSRVVDVTEVARLTDGVIAVEGDHWETSRTSVLRTGSSEVDWDLGRPVHVAAAYLQGDNNDDFFLLGSEDGQTYRRLWASGTIHGPGMRARHTRDLDATVRYLRISAHGGDPAVSLAEVAVFDTVPAAWPPRFAVKAGKKPLRPGEVESLWFAVVGSVALLAHRWTFPRWLRIATVAAPIVAGYILYEAVTSAWPPDQSVIDALRAVAALVSAAAVLRLAWRPEDVMPRFVNGSLWAMAILAMTTFYNMWQPQFSYEEKGRNTWVHTWDMRVYYPTAKYFDELGFDGLYVASVAGLHSGVNPVSGQFSVGATGRLIENGELGAPVREMTIASDLVSMLKAVQAVGGPGRWVPFGGSVRSAPVLIAEMQVSGA